MAAAFPMFFLLFLVLLPDGVVEWLETASKLGSAETTHLFFSVSGMSVLPGGTGVSASRHRTGGRARMQRNPVELGVVLITSLLVSNMFLRTTWRRTVLVLFVIPLGLLRNGFRILVIGLLCVHIGPEMIHSIIHRRGGPLFFALSLIPLFALLWWFTSRRGKPRGPQATQQAEA